MKNTMYDPIFVNKKAKGRIIKHANHLLKFWKEYHERANGDPWLFLRERQSFYDALNSMKHSGLIKEFDLNGITFNFKEKGELK